MTGDYGCKAQDILAAIGPGIDVCCFETHRDVPDGLRAGLGNAAERYIHPIAGTEKFHVDLKGANAHWLQEMGVPQENIARCGACTACRTDLFWSHRRMGSTRGSMAAVIQLI
jgi:copper oxidase (laccase) domain-containing protein